MKDKRSKCCPNELCEHNQNRKKHQYKAEDTYCTNCGTELVFVCQKCFNLISDEGPEHRICGNCDAERGQKMAKIKVNASRAGGAAAAVVAVLVPTLIKKP